MPIQSGVGREDAVHETELPAARLATAYVGGLTLPPRNGATVLKRSGSAAPQSYCAGYSSPLHSNKSVVSRRPSLSSSRFGSSTRAPWVTGKLRECSVTARSTSGR